MPKPVTKTAGAAAMLASDVIALIARMLSGTMTPEDVTTYGATDPTSQAVEEALNFGRPLIRGKARNGGDAALIGSAVDRIRLAVADAAKRPDGVPEGHVVRSSKSVDYDNGVVTVSFYWDEPARREDRTTGEDATVPVVEDAAPSEDQPTA